MARCVTKNQRVVWILNRIEQIQIPGSGHSISKEKIKHGFKFYLNMKKKIELIKSIANCFLSCYMLYVKKRLRVLVQTVKTLYCARLGSR